MSNNTTTIQCMGPGNPLLYSNLTINVQPYWLLIAQSFTILLLIRLYSRFWPWKKDENKTWFTTIEIFILDYFLECKQEDENKNDESEMKYFKEKISKLKSMNRFNVLDLLISLVSIVQIIMIFIRQSKCMCVVGASLWRCYNAFGYDLHNYTSSGLFISSVVWVIKSKNIPNGFTEKITVALMFICVLFSCLFCISYNE